MVPLVPKYTQIWPHFSFLYSESLSMVNSAKMIPPKNAGRFVTANIGWYVVSILHDRLSCSFDITWP